MGADKLIERTRDLEGIAIVAVIDTGVDLNHPFLRDRSVAGYDVLGKDSDPTDSISTARIWQENIKYQAPMQFKIVRVPGTYY